MVAFMYGKDYEDDMKEEESKGQTEVPNAEVKFNNQGKLRFQLFLAHTKH